MAYQQMGQLNKNNSKTTNNKQYQKPPNTTISLVGLVQNKK
jgi:hypothetical protein